MDTTALCAGGTGLPAGVWVRCGSGWGERLPVPSRVPSLLFDIIFLRLSK